MLKMRIRRLEQFFHALRDESRLIFPGDSDLFMTGLGGNKERYLREDGGFDALAALSDTAAVDWQDYERGI